MLWAGLITQFYTCMLSTAAGVVPMLVPQQGWVVLPIVPCDLHLRPMNL